MSARDYTIRDVRGIEIDMVSLPAYAWPRKMLDRKKAWNRARQREGEGMRRGKSGTQFYYLRARQQRWNHRIPWNCPNFWDGCNCDGGPYYDAPHPWKLAR